MINVVRIKLVVGRVPTRSVQMSKVASWPHYSKFVISFDRHGDVIYDFDIL